MCACFTNNNRPTAGVKRTPRAEEPSVNRHDFFAPPPPPPSLHIKLNVYILGQMWNHPVKIPHESVRKAADTNVWPMPHQPLTIQARDGAEETKHEGDASDSHRGSDGRCSDWWPAVFIAELL